MEKVKVAFITCVSKEDDYRECLLYIHRLNVPENCEIECIAVRNAESMAQGCNAAMQASDARYKVYLHQDVFILNRNFIADMLRVFEADEKIGMAAMAGAEKMPPDGIWWNGVKKYGKIYENHARNMSLLQFDGQASPAADVEAIDGFLFATRYDIPFRADIFDGWHFYDASQTAEFRKRGYRVVVPRMEKPWCAHACGVPATGSAYEEYRRRYVKEYLQATLPLVSILIPTYNQTKYLKIALESAIAQTYPKIEIVIGDDSTTDEVEEFVKPYLAKHNNVRYFRNRERAGDYGITNCKKLMKNSRGEYISFLFHDDVIEPEKILYMMNYAVQYPHVTLITSARQPIGDAGENLDAGKIDAFKKLFKKDTLINGIQLIRAVVTNRLNVIGEPSVCMFRKRDMDVEHYNSFDGIPYDANVDVAMWAGLLEHGDAIYIARSLTCFRLSPEQNSNSLELQLSGHIDWLNLVMSCAKKGGYMTLEEYRYLLCRDVHEAMDFLARQADKIAVCQRKLFKLHMLLEKATEEMFKSMPFGCAEDAPSFSGAGVGSKASKSTGRILAVDDFFPNPLSAFRYQEFLYYLEKMDCMDVLCTGRERLSTATQTLNRQVECFRIQHPALADRVHEIGDYVQVGQYRLFYFVFLRNAFSYYTYAEQAKCPFVLELYPAGGFFLQNPESDVQLRKVMSSPFFRKVLVTQPITRDYLIDGGFCRESDICYIFGGVEPLEIVGREPEGKRHYGIDKKSLDICFVAAKYDRTGRDKGYDLFVEAAKRLCHRYDFVRFHVVGGFNETDIDVSSMRESITFYGWRGQDWLNTFYRDKDILISPNMPGVLAKGSFDGFPLGCSADAGLRGTAVFCTDPLSLNTRHFRHRQDMVFIEHDVEDIVRQVSYYAERPQELKELAVRGMQTMQQLYSEEVQLQPRRSFLRETLDS